MTSLHGMFRDAQAASSANQQLQTLRRVKGLAKKQEETERQLRVLEVFVVTVYTGELVHLLGEAAEFSHHYVMLGMGLMVLAFVTVLAHVKAAGQHTPSRIFTLARVALILTVLSLGSWLLWGWFVDRPMKSGHSVSNSPQGATVHSTDTKPSIDKVPKTAPVKPESEPTTPK
jgi:hypothetical protein